MMARPEESTCSYEQFLLLGACSLFARNIALHNTRILLQPYFPITHPKFSTVSICATITHFYQSRHLFWALGSLSPILTAQHEIPFAAIVFLIVILKVSIVVAQG